MYRLIRHADGPVNFELDPGEGEGNRFTVVLGPNGTGKSKLLRSIAEKHRRGLPAAAPVKPQRFEGMPAGILPDERRTAEPSMLLVLSNMVTDIFVNTSKRRDSYRYLGLRQASNNTSTGALRDATIAAILECSRTPGSKNRLDPVLEALGGDKFFVSFEPSLGSVAKLGGIQLAHVENFLHGLERDTTRSHFVSPEVLFNELRSFEKFVEPRDKLLGLDDKALQAFWSLSARFQLEAADLIRILRRLRITRLRIHLRLGEQVFDLEDLSTGQLLLLSTFARIAAYAAPNSLIIIDEPEVGLHPNWQSAWIPLLRSTIPEDYACHLFIATHSPYLVSDADDVLVPGEEWGTFIQFDEPYQGRSVENILYRVFGARIAGNLMVEDDLRILVQFISREHGYVGTTKRKEVTQALHRLRRMQGEDTEDLNLVLDQAAEILGK